MQISRFIPLFTLLAACCQAQGMGDMAGPDQGGKPGGRGMQPQQQCSPAVEEPQMVSPKPKPAFWYYCAQSKMFYPHVQTCANGWKIIPAQPPADDKLPDGPA